MAIKVKLEDLIQLKHQETEIINQLDATRILMADMIASIRADEESEINLAKQKLDEIARIESYLKNRISGSTTPTPEPIRVEPTKDDEYETAIAEGRVTKKGNISDLHARLHQLEAECRHPVDGAGFV